MTPPLRIVVLFHPTSTEARRLAEHLHRSLSARPSGYGARVPVWFGPTEPDGRPRGDIDLDEAEHTVVVLLVDRRMVSRAPDAEVAEAWEARALEVFRAVGETAQHAFVPVALDDRAFTFSGELSDRSFVRLEFRQSPDRDRHLLHHVVIRSLRLLLGHEASTADQADKVPEAPLVVFVSHAKKDLYRLGQASGPVPRVLAGLAQSPVQAWYDASNIQPNEVFTERITDGVRTGTALLAIVGDAWSTREWCRTEALLAKSHRRPVVVVDALMTRTDRLFPYVGNALTLRWRAASTMAPTDDDSAEIRLWWKEKAEAVELEDAEEVILATLLESMRHEHELLKLAHHEADDTVVLGSPPEALTLDHLDERVQHVWYPDPPLGREELELLERGRASVTFHTPLSELALWERPRRIDAVAVSLSGSPDAERYGGSPLHLAQLAEDLNLYLLLAGIRIVYGGQINHGGTQPGDATNYTERLFDLVYSYAPLAMELGASRFHPIVNMVPWPIHLGYGDDEHDLYGREAELVPMPRPAALPLGDDVLEPGDGGFFPPARVEQRFAWALALTEMRQAQCERTSARVVLGGKIAGSKSRYPGVLEEALISLRRGHPTYLLGAFGGAARLTIDALQGLDREELTSAWFSDNDPQWDELVALYESHELPLDTAEALAQELAQLGSDGPAAALNNGLSDEENVELFSCADPQRATELILRGLKELGGG